MNEIKAIIGLGNPGDKYHHTRHNIGFRVVDTLCEHHGCSWQAHDKMEYAKIIVGDRTIILIKPQTSMNASGDVIPLLKKQGIDHQNIIVVHDELELPFGTVKMKLGGSAKGHNGLRSIIERCGQEFMRLRVGIGRPDNRERVASYVLENFTEDDASVMSVIDKAVKVLEHEIR